MKQKHIPHYYSFWQPFTVASPANSIAAIHWPTALSQRAEECRLFVFADIPPILAKAPLKCFCKGWCFFCLASQSLPLAPSEQGEPERLCDLATDRYQPSLGGESGPVISALKACHSALLRPHSQWKSVPNGCMWWMEQTWHKNLCVRPTEMAWISLNLCILVISNHVDWSY